MTNFLEHNFSIKRITKSSDDSYIKALNIYNETTPFEIKTPTNEITYWLNKQKISTPFEIYIFALYLNNEIIGLSMTTYVKKTKIVIDEYLAVCEQYRMQTIFLVFESLIQNYYRESGIEISYYLTEISYRDNGKSMDRESRISLKMLCIEEYGKIDALYYSLPLGLNNHESNFRAHIYIKAIDTIKTIAPRTYLDIVESIYYDYWYSWYTPLLTSSDMNIYKTLIDKNFDLIKKSVSANTSTVTVMYSSCDSLECYSEASQRFIPVKKNKNIAYFFVLIITIIILPIFIIWMYGKALMYLNMSISSVSTMIGTIISAVITSITALILARKTK